MFTLILIHSVAGFFNRAGEYYSAPLSPDASAAEALRVARSHLDTTHNGVPLYKAVGLRVGDRRTSPVLWVR